MSLIALLSNRKCLCIPSFESDALLVRALLLYCAILMFVLPNTLVNCILSYLPIF